MMDRTGFQADHFRMFGTDEKVWKHMLISHELCYLRYLRKRQAAKSHFARRIYGLRQILFDRKYGLSILSDHIGDGLFIGHGHGINVHPSAVIGKNCNLNKNVTVGESMRGTRKGAPVIGNDVWIGTGAIVVGKITVGDDVLIAPNAFVNTDVPAHSVVTGNPCVIKPKEDATGGYILNRV